MDKIKSQRARLVFHPYFHTEVPISPGSGVHQKNLNLVQVLQNFPSRTFTGDPRFARFRLTRIHSTRIFLGLQTLLLRGTLFSIRGSLYDAEPTLIPNALKKGCVNKNNKTFRFTLS